MGRGRAKAKQTKVARALKYGGPQTDFDRLQAELASSPAYEANDHESEELDASYEVVDDPYADDPYAKYYDDDESEDSDETPEAGK